VQSGRRTAAADGTFAIDGVLPGSYQLFVSGASRKFSGYRQVAIDPERPGEAPPPLGLGEVAVKETAAK
jgi:hypothetical protein